MRFRAVRRRQRVDASLSPDHAIGSEAPRVHNKGLDQFRLAFLTPALAPLAKGPQLHPNWAFQRLDKIRKLLPVGLSHDPEFALAIFGIDFVIGENSVRLWSNIVPHVLLRWC